MATTEEDYIPTYEELNVPELKLTSPELRAGSLYFGKYCDKICQEYVICKQDLGTREGCLQEGKEVTKCGFEFFGKVKSKCLPEFLKYSTCIDHARPNRDAFDKCRQFQLPFDDCLKENLGLDRPYIGYFSKPRIYTGDRPDPGPPLVTIKGYSKNPPTEEELRQRELQAKVIPFRDMSPIKPDQSKRQ